MTQLQTAVIAGNEELSFVQERPGRVEKVEEGDYRCR